MKSLAEYFKSGVTTKDFEVVFGTQKVHIKLRTITSKEYDKTISRFNIGPDAVLSSFVLIQRPILGYALVEIDHNGIEQLPEVSEMLKLPNHPPLNLIVEDALGNLPPAVIDLFYAKYLELADEAAAERDEVKKS